MQVPSPFGAPKGVILYGSAARRQAASSRDMDMLALLAPPLDYFVELRILVDVLYPIQRAETSVRAAKEMLEEGCFDLAASRAYDAAFYATSALLLNENIDTSEHSRVIASIVYL